MSDWPSIFMMELYIETLTGVMMELIVHPSETIQNVKEKINRLEGFPVSEQHLIWQSQELQNDLSLQEYKITDGATLRLVLNMRGGPINTRRVPIEESSLREMADYFSEPAGDDHFSAENPVTVILYQGEIFNVIRLVDRDVSSSSSYSINGGSDNDSPVPKERQEENETTKNKMKLLKEKMENLSLAKQKKLGTRPHVPRPPSGRPKSKTKLRHAATGRRSGMTNRIGGLPPVGPLVPLLSPVEPTAVENPVAVHTRLPTPKIIQPSPLPSCSTPPSGRKSSASVLQQMRNLGSLRGSPIIRQADSATNSPIDATGRASSQLNSVLRCRSRMDPSNCAASSADSLLSQQLQKDLPPSPQVLSSQITSPDPYRERNRREMVMSDSAADLPRTKSSQEKAHSQTGSPCENVSSGKELEKQTEAVFTNDRLPSPTNPWLLNSAGGVGHIIPPIRTIAHAPLRNLPFAPPSGGGRLLPQRHMPEGVKESCGDSCHPAEAMLGYLVGPTRRPGTEKKSVGMTLQSFNHRGARAVSGMLRDIVCSAGRAQTGGYVLAGGKLAQVPKPQTTAADTPTADSPSARRVSSGSREDCVTPMRVRLPSVKVKKKTPTKRCAVCRKRTKLATGFQCRCGENFCLAHLCAEAHGCTYDYKAEGRKLIEQNNPVVTAPKLPKI